MSTTLTLIICTCIFSFVFYLFLHKRRHPKRPPLPPGPKAWPIIGNLLQLGPKPHQSMAALARVYGPLMHLKMGFVHVVVVSSPSVAEQFLKVQDANFSSRPRNAGATYGGYNYQDLVFAPYGPRWRLFRKICNRHLFSSKALDDFSWVRQEEAAILTRAIASAGGKGVRLDEMLNVYTTNAIARMAFGRRVVGHGYGGGDAKAEDFKSMVVGLLELAGVFNIGDFIPPLEFLDLQGVVSKLKKLHKRLDVFITSIFEERKINGPREMEGHTDILSMLMFSEDVDDGEGGKLTETNIKGLLLNLFVAGTDTSSTAVEWAIAQLIRHPKILAKAQNEIDNVVGKDRLVTEFDLPKFKFLQAIVKETLRLHPSSPLSLPRMSHESCEINGYYIPKGSTLLVNVWAIDRDPNVWADPLEFRPQRFMGGGERPNADVRGNDFEVIPFGAGRRICAGMGLGIRTLQLLIATLIHSFDFELGNGQLAQNLSMEEAYGLGMRRAEPLVVHLGKLRLARHVYQT